MYKLTRNFSIVGAIAFVLVTVLVGFLIRQNSIADLVVTTEAHSIALSRAFANSVLPKYRRLVTDSADAPATEAQRDARLRELDGELRDLAYDIPILKIKLYNLAGTTVYSSNSAEIGQHRADNTGLQTALKSGAAVSMLSHRDSVSAFSGEVFDRHVVESYIPVRRKDGSTEAVYEMYVDVTAIVERINMSTRNAILAMAAILALLYWAVYLVVQRGSGIIRRQFEELERRQSLEDRNQDLEREIDERRIIERDLRQNERALTALHKIASSQDTDSNERIQQVLELGTKTFGLPMGIVGRVANDTYTFAYVSGPEGAPAPGTQLDMETTYCQFAYKADAPVGIPDVRDSWLSAEPCYELLGLEAYLGSALFVSGKRYGTLCFAGSEARAEKFSEGELSLLKLFATWVGTEIQRSESETRDRLISRVLETTTQGFWHVDTEAITIDVNDAMCRILGRPREEIIGCAVYDFVDGDDLVVFKEQIARRAKGHKGAYQINLRRPDGSRVFCQNNATPIIDGNGRQQGSVGLWTDLAERKAAEDALRQSEEKFRSVFENTADGIFIHDNEGRILEVNESACSFLGYTRKELLALTLPDLDQNFNFQIAKASWDRLLKTGDGFRHQGTYQRKDDSEFPVEIAIDRIPWGGSDQMIAVARDVTEQHAAAELIINSEQKFRTLNENAADAIIVHDLEGRFVQVNQYACDMLGYTRDEFMSLRVPDVEVGNSPEQLQEIFDVITTEKAQMFEGIQRHKDGTLIPVEANISLVDWEGEQNVMVIARDVTQRRNADKALRDAKEAAEVANIAKSRFLASASHDLRQPLQALSLYLAVLRRGKDETKRIETADKMAAALGELSGLLDSLLDVSKLEAGLVEPDSVNFPVEELFRLGDEFAAIAESQGATFKVIHSGAIIRSDPTLLQSIVRNLVSNAVKYAPTGRILLGCRRRGDRLRIEVHDTGIGIAPEYQERIFDEFFQLGNDARDREMGLGLGLSIVRRTADLLGHELQVHSEPGKGTAFTIEVPLAAAGHSQTSPVARPARDSMIEGKPLVVAIDDDVIVLDGMSELLTELGCEVITSHGASAKDSCVTEILSRCGDRHPELIIADYRLPAGNNGVELIAEIRARSGSTAPAILLTGEMAGEFLTGSEIDHIQVLHKPVSANVLATAIKSTMLTHASEAAE